ncbi:MAG: excinuclease ABC subunit UvrC [Clostridia bacterium]|nr:excinuclease ABC subunit UvrC [Clostridia bacterium]MBQ4620786.1 excinuclease ABC subunit UvrC [Clostridia bacterium]
MTSNLEWKIQNLPESPGCYLMKSKGEIIYVGKAKNLKNRVRQYFHASANHTAKVRAMVEKVDDFDIVLVDGELEALILECNLIKKHMPWYNILLKDDKHYPYIRIDTRERFPAVELKREQKKDGAKYFGPYIGASMVREVMDITRLLFPIRHCTKAIKPGMRARPCLHHQVGGCLAPCAGLVTEEEYNMHLKNVIRFLSGHYDEVLDELKNRMMDAAKQMNYEKAATYRDRIKAVTEMMQKQKAIDVDGEDRDVIATIPVGADALVSVMLIRGGRLVSSESYTLERAADENAGEILTSFMTQYYSTENPPAPEVIVSDQPPETETLSELLSEVNGRRKVKVHLPVRGDKAQLVKMAKKNLLDEALKIEKRKLKSRERTEGALKELAETLMLEKPPRRIEGYDISNTQGVLSVASEVVMIGGVIDKKEYRHYRIKTVEGANDFASMHEVITRRFKRYLKEKEEGVKGSFSDLPDLILIDGGRGQLNFAQDAMHALGFDIPMFGLAERIDEIVLPDQEESILLDRHSEALHLIQRLRDEAHRFAITHHRKLRASRSVASRLEEIPGIGPKRRRAILTHFKTVEALRNAKVEEIALVPGVNKDNAEAVYRHLHAEDENSDASD